MNPNYRLFRKSLRTSAEKENIPRSKIVEKEKRWSRERVRARLGFISVFVVSNFWRGRGRRRRGPLRYPRVTVLCWRGVIFDVGWKRSFLFFFFLPRFWRTRFRNGVIKALVFEKEAVLIFWNVFGSIFDLTGFWNMVNGWENLKRYIKDI